jgi:N-carbamoylputrescine amidase
VVACNRIGVERFGASEITFYGGSFITDETGAILAQASPDQPEVITARFDLAAHRERRAGWGLFRDRRPELYGALSRY